MGIRHVSTIDTQHFRTASANLGDNQMGGSQGLVLLEKRLDAPVRDPMDFRLVDRVNQKAGGDVHAINKCQLVCGLSNGTRRDDPHLLRSCDPILTQLGPVRFQDAYAVLQRVTSDGSFCEGVLPQADPLREHFERVDDSVFGDLSDRQPDGTRSDVNHGNEANLVRCASCRCRWCLRREIHIASTRRQSPSRHRSQ